MEPSKLHRLLVPYSITRIIKKGIMISFVIGGKSMFVYFSSIIMVLFENFILYIVD